MGNYDTWQSAISGTYQSRSIAVCDWRWKAGSTREMPRKNVSYSFNISHSLLIIILFPYSYHLMQSCWKRYSSDRPHFDQIVTIVSSFLERTKRPGSGYYTDSDSEDGDSNVQTGKMPSRTPSIRSGMLKGTVMCATQLNWLV